VTETNMLVCRAQTSKGCLNGQPMSTQIPDEEGFPPSRMSDDGTFDGQSIVCDACYVQLMPLTPSGRGLHHELDAAIAKARRDGA
jgi:hypothetical protein